MVTDGEPTAHLDHGVPLFSYPPSPMTRPKPKKIRAKDSGERSTTPDTNAVTVNTTAIKPKARRKSGNRFLFYNP